MHSLHNLWLVRCAISAFAKPGHPRATSWANTLSRRTTVLQGDGLLVLYLSLGTTLHTVRFHFAPLLGNRHATATTPTGFPCARVPSQGKVASSFVSTRQRGKCQTHSLYSSSSNPNCLAASRIAFKVGWSASTPSSAGNSSLKSMPRFSLLGCILAAGPTKERKTSAQVS